LFCVQGIGASLMRGVRPRWLTVRIVMSKTHMPREDVWIVMRADLFHRPEVDVEVLVTPKAVFRSKEHAESEIDRLNVLHPDGRVRYWCAFSRLFGDGGVATDAVDPA